MSGAAYNRGKSEQVVGTPRDFIMAVQHRFGRIQWDLAANEENAVVEGIFKGNFYSEACDSLKTPWPEDKSTHWLNPPFANIEPWAKKCSVTSERCGWTLLLVPASIGTNWWINHVEGKAMVYGLSPRIKFVGAKDPYPKDLALCAYGYGVQGHTSWRWKP